METARQTAQEAPAPEAAKAAAAKAVEPAKAPEAMVAKEKPKVQEAIPTPPHPSSPSVLELWKPQALLEGLPPPPSGRSCRPVGRRESQGQGKKARKMARKASRRDGANTMLTEIQQQCR